MEVANCKRQAVGSQNFDDFVKLEEAGPAVNKHGFDLDCHW
jgi:hypothetical protein